MKQTPHDAYDAGWKVRDRIKKERLTTIKICAGVGVVAMLVGLWLGHLFF